MLEPCAARSPLSYGSKAACHLVPVPDGAAGAEDAELDEPESPLLVVFDSDFDSVLASDPVLELDSVFVSGPVFFSADADSVAELLPSDELLLAA